MSKIKLLALLLLFTSTLSWGQTARYLVRFKDKKNSVYSTTRPLEFLSQRAIDRRTRQKITITERDFPVNKTYLDELRRSGAKVIYSTRWLNGALIEADAATLAAVNQLAFVDATAARKLTIAGQKDEPQPDEQLAAQRRKKLLKDPDNTTRTMENYGSSAPQIMMLGIDEMHRQGYRGEGVVIAVLDGGFSNADINPALAGMKVLGTYDFVMGNTSVYEDAAHGANVLSIMAARKDGEIIGASPNASYYLLRTEDGATERPVEEAYWLIGAEYADSVGVDIIHTSLGYNTFDNPQFDYKWTDLNGNTALVTIAADLAGEAGMLVVTSAGNEGNKAWQKVTSPADGDYVLAVGAVDKDRNYAALSSRGYTTDGRVKPDVAAVGSGTAIALPSGALSFGSGTSYAAPLISGLAAGLWQANPNLTNVQLMNIIRKAGHRYYAPNDSVGYGIPDFKRAQTLVTAINDPVFAEELVKLYPNPAAQDFVLLMFSETLVNKEVTLSVSDMTGRLIFEKQFTVRDNVVYLETEELLPAAGVYLVRVQREGYVRTFKLVK